MGLRLLVLPETWCVFQAFPPKRRNWPAAWKFSTDGVYTAGAAGIPTIGFGPGEERHAHAVDEQVRLENVLSAAAVYANLPLALLRTA